MSYLSRVATSFSPLQNDFEWLHLQPKCTGRSVVVLRFEVPVGAVEPDLISLTCTCRKHFTRRTKVVFEGSKVL